MLGEEIRSEQLRFAVTPEERRRWNAGLRKRSLNGSAIFRRLMEERLAAWREEDAKEETAA